MGQKYIVVAEQTKALLEGSVNSWLGQNYRCVGGVNVITGTSTDNDGFYQSMYQDY